MRSSRPRPLTSSTSRFVAASPEQKITSACPSAWRTSFALHAKIALLHRAKTRSRVDTKSQHLERYEASREFVYEIRRVIDDAYFDRMTRLIYSTDASIYQMIPVGVAVPRNADEVSAAIEIAGKHDVPVLPRGGGSSLAGQAVDDQMRSHDI